MEIKTEKWKSQLNSFGEKVAKAPLQIRQKLYTGPKTHDAEVEYLKERFKLIHAGNNRLIGACCKLEESIYGILRQFQSTIETFETIDQMSEEQKPFYREFNNLIKRFELIRVRIENDSPLFKENVIEPMNKVNLMCSRVHNAIEHRNYLLHNVDHLKHKLDSYTPNKMATPGVKFEQDRMRIEVKYQKAVESFKPFNQQLRIELEIFFELLNSIFKNWFLNYYYITYSIYYNMYTFIATCNEVRDIVMSVNKSTEKDSFSPSTAQIIEAIETGSSKIVSEFHARYDSVSVEVSKLNVVSFKGYYERISINALDSVTKANNTFQGDESPAFQMYCKAITDFHPSETDGESALILKKNDVIKLYRKENDVWWYGQCLRTNKLGYFPAQCTSLERY